MVFYVDENFPPQLAVGVNTLVAPPWPGVEVRSILEAFGQGARDEDWIPEVGNKGGLVITQDLRIHRSRSLRDLYLESGVGVFFFAPPSKTGYSYWDMVENVVRRWRRMMELAETHNPPFAFRVTARASNFEKIG